VNGRSKEYAKMRVDRPERIMPLDSHRLEDQHGDG
jgi:hypothetical protein